MPCKMVSARPDEQGTLPYHCGLRLFTMVMRSSCGPIKAKRLDDEDAHFVLKVEGSAAF